MSANVQHWKLSKDASKYYTLKPLGASGVHKETRPLFTVGVHGIKKIELRRAQSGNAELHKVERKSKLAAYYTFNRRVIS